MKADGTRNTKVSSYLFNLGYCSTWKYKYAIKQRLRVDIFRDTLLVVFFAFCAV